MVVLQTLSGKQFTLSQGDNEIGREQGAAVPLAVAKVSRHHALLRWDGNQALLMDLGSSNGTYLNGNLLQPQQLYALKVGDVIDIGGIDGRLFVNQIERERARPLMETPLPAPPVDQSSRGAAVSLENAHLLRRVHELEEEVLSLKCILLSPENPSIPARFRQGVSFCQNNWTFLSFLGGLLILLYINLAYGVDYFESYRNTGDTNRLSQFYTEMGDELLERQEWQAAKEAYQTAVEIKPSNIRARYGVAQMETFDPVGEEKFSAPEVVDVRLDYFVQLAQSDNQARKYLKRDYRIPYLRGVQYFEQFRLDAAKAEFEKATGLNKNFVGGYTALGSIFHIEGDLEQATIYYQQALGLPLAQPADTTCLAEEQTRLQKQGLDLNQFNITLWCNLEQTPSGDFSAALNGMGFVKLVQGDFVDAITYLERANRLASNVDTLLGLGDAYRYNGDFMRALYYHESALALLNISDSESERFAAGSYFYNLLPLDPNDQETARQIVWFYKPDQKEMFTEFAMSFDYALQGKVIQANRNWQSAINTLMDQHGGDKSMFIEFFINQMNFIALNLTQRTPETDQWFHDKWNELAAIQ